MLKMYLEMCCFYDVNHVPQVFINTTGLPMSQSNISSAMTSAFKQSGYEKRVNCTKVRKLLITENRKINPEDNDKLAKHMNLESKSISSNCSSKLNVNFREQIIYLIALGFF